MASWSGYPFHLTRNSKSFGSVEMSSCCTIVVFVRLDLVWLMILQSRMLSTSYSLSSSFSMLSSCGVESDGSSSGPTGGRKNESGC